GVGEGHLLHRKALRVKSADFAKSGSLFQSFPKFSRWPAPSSTYIQGQLLAEIGHRTPTPQAISRPTNPDRAYRLSRRSYQENPHALGHAT
ncbi:hypothetical protein, partial [Pseudomonas aeruginosa]|uniref:hypothetical protein n=1 Tax=Pseudomonas aeruginosa TaxID=287 RepID=UPI001E33A3E9